MLEIYSQYPNVLLLDYTYKTNRYNVPLLNLYGVTLNNKNTVLKCAFLKNEQSKGSIQQSLNYIRDMLKEHNIPLPRVIIYDRAQSLINALNDMPTRTSLRGVPYLLYYQYQNKCVLAQLQKDRHSFGGTYRINGQRINLEGVISVIKEYLVIVQLKTKHKFDELLLKLRNKLEPHQRKFYRYLNSNQFIYKDLYVSVQTNYYIYFGNYTTSRLEGAYASLKRQLQNS